MEFSPRSAASPEAFYLSREIKPENLAAGTARLFLGVHRALFRYRRLPKRGPACTPPPARRLRSFPHLAAGGDVTIFVLGRG